jgi:hypothetical protein
MLGIVHNTKENFGFAFGIHCVAVWIISSSSQSSQQSSSQRALGGLSRQGNGGSQI